MTRPELTAWLRRFAATLFLAAGAALVLLGEGLAFVGDRMDPEGGPANG